MKIAPFDILRQAQYKFLRTQGAILIERRPKIPRCQGVASPKARGRFGSESFAFLVLLWPRLPVGQEDKRTYNQWIIWKFNCSFSLPLHPSTMLGASFQRTKRLACGRQKRDFFKGIFCDKHKNHIYSSKFPTRIQKFLTKNKYYAAEKDKHLQKWQTNALVCFALSVH